MTLSIYKSDRVRIIIAEYAIIIEKSVIIACLKWAGTIILLVVLLFAMFYAVSEMQ